MADRKRGRRAKYAVDRNNHPVVGLSFDKSNGQFYSTHVRPKKYFGADLDRAIAAFRAWEAQRKGKPLVNIAVPVPDPQARVRIEEPPEPELPDPARLSDPAYIGEWLRPRAYAAMNEDALFEWARTAIFEDRVRFAERVGIPQIAWIDEIEPPEPSLTLQEVGKLYFGRKRQLSDHWRRKQKTYWEEFVKLVGNKTLREIDGQDVDRYHDRVWAEHEKHQRSSTYLSHRFQAVRTILRHALNQGRDQAQTRCVLDLCRRFEHARKTGANPQPISREDFHRLLEVSTPKWKAVLLLALNCGFYPSEVAAVEKPHIDLSARMLVMDRHKTGIPRIAVLWDRTVEAIIEYQQIEPHESDSLFVSATGLPYNANHIGRNFRRRRVDAKLADSVTFESIRDGAYTAAVDGGASVDQAKMLAGHRVTGVSDFYLKRNPRMVAEACAAIERAYFG